MTVLPVPVEPPMRARASIAHLDADAFFASVEQHQKPSLRGRPVLVGGAGGRGVVAAASYEARKAGARSAMSMEQARNLCPEATVVVPRFEAYTAYSRQIMAVLAEVSHTLEPISIDEAFAELEHIDGTNQDLRRLAVGLQARALERTGLAVSIGLGRSKLIAKLASDAAKPAGVLLVEPAHEDEFLLPLPVRALWGVGPVMAARLEQLGVRTVADLRAQPIDTLTMVAGEAAGTNLYRVARGWDDRPVEPSRERKSAGAERTFETDLHGRAAILAALEPVTDAALRRLTRHGGAARTVVAKVKYADFSTVTRSLSLPSPTADAAALREAARRAVDLADLSAPVRLLGVSFHGLSEHAQLMLPLDEPDAPLPAPHAVFDDRPGDMQPVRATADNVAPGLDVTHPEHGRGWVVRVREDGSVAVRFETAATGPGRQFNLDPHTSDLHLARPLGPDGQLAARPGPHGDDAATT